MKKRYLNYIFLFVFLILEAINCFSANLLEGFRHHENIGVILSNLFRFIAMTGFLWIPLALLYDSKMAKLNGFYFVLPATILELAFSYFYLNIYPMNILEICVFYLRGIVRIVLIITLFLKEKDRRYSLKYFNYFIVSLLFFIPLNFLEPLAIKLHEKRFLLFRLFSVWHFLFLFLFIGFALGLEKFLEKKNNEIRYLIIFGLSIILLYKLLCRFSFVRLQDYQEVKGFMGALPFYVCSFGMLLLPFAIYSRNKVFQGILFLVNTPGAIIVLVNPSTGITNIFHYNVLYFFVTHIMLFGITMMLPIYLEGKPNLKTVKITGILLACYFITMVFLNGLAIIISNGNNPNFSFVSKSPIPVPIDNMFLIRIHRIRFSPIYLILLWAAQYGLACVTYLIYRTITKRKEDSVAS